MSGNPRPRWSGSAIDQPLEMRGVAIALYLDLGGSGIDLREVRGGQDHIDGADVLLQA